MGNTQTFFQGIGHAAFGMVGQGPAYDPIGDKRADLEKATKDYNDVMQQNTMAMFSDITDSQLKILKDINSKATFDEKNSNYLHELSMEKIDQVSICMQLISAMTIIIVFYLMALRNGNAKAYG